jgi:hypothetical protein
VVVVHPLDEFARDKRVRERVLSSGRRGALECVLHRVKGVEERVRLGWREGKRVPAQPANDQRGSASRLVRKHLDHERDARFLVGQPPRVQRGRDDGDVIRDRGLAVGRQSRYALDEVDAASSSDPLPDHVDWMRLIKSFNIE